MLSAEQWVAILGAASVLIGAVAKLVHEMREVKIRVADLGDQLRDHDAASTRRLTQHEAASEKRSEQVAQQIQGRAD